MKRGAVHLAFGIAASVFAAIACYDWATLRHAQAVAKAVSAVSTVTVDSPTQHDDAPEVRLASAVALSKAGRANDAQRLFDALIAQEADPTLRAAALFDLANMQLREAAGSDAAGPIRSMPSLEQARSVIARRCGLRRATGTRAITSSARCGSRPKRPAITTMPTSRSARP